jgi:hypothetical protein
VRDASFQEPNWRRFGGAAAREEEEEEAPAPAHRLTLDKLFSLDQNQ